MVRISSLALRNSVQVEPFHPWALALTNQGFYRRRARGRPLFSSFNDDDVLIDDQDEDEESFLRRELLHLEELESILEDIGDVDVSEEEEDGVYWDEESLDELLQSIGDDDTLDADESTYDDDRDPYGSALERALLQGVVPVSAGVGSACLPGDYGFDPLNLASTDYFLQAQNTLLNLFPSDNTPKLPTTSNRPKALILRDYREAEIRHGRLAMLAAFFWPLQEMLDRLLLDDDQFGPLIFGPVTLPYFPLVMTAIMMLLGYLDIYSQAIKDRDQIGEAFLPGDCFWDPLRVLDGAPNSMKRNMQERELFNGRAAMLAVLIFTWEEAITHLPLISIEGNELLLEPAYQVPFIQEWLDQQFAVDSSLSAVDFEVLDTP